jgi:hypothetical protein
MRRLLPGLAVTVALASVTAGSAPAGAVVVDLTVESSTAPAPLFAGAVDTSPHAVDGGDGSGPHPCWGAPGATPAPTATGALDDALRGGAISWRGNWDPSFGDFFIDRIGSFASAPPDRYWSLTVNGGFTAGGCLTTVAAGDAVRFFYGPLFGPDPPGSPGAAGKAPGVAQPGGKTQATVRHRTAKQLRRLAAGAGAYLRRANGVGDDWAELALALRGRREPSGAARRLGERLRALPGGGAVGQDVDSTALAAWALAMRGQRAKARRLAAFVRDSQAPDGGFPALPGGDSNAQSTGLGLVALRVAGLGPRSAQTSGGLTPLDYLAALARRDGSIAYRPHSNPTPVWTTAQALLGLTGRSRLLGFAAGRGAG